MVFEEKDLNKLAGVCRQYEELEKELSELRKVIEGLDCTRSKPDYDATQAFLNVSEMVTECSSRLRVAQLFAEIAYARHQDEVDWEDVDEMEMMILEYYQSFQLCQRKALFGR